MLKNTDSGSMVRAGLTSEQIAHCPTQDFLNWQKSLRIYESSQKNNQVHRNRAIVIDPEQQEIAWATGRSLEIPAEILLKLTIFEGLIKSRKSGDEAETFVLEAEGASLADELLLVSIINQDRIDYRFTSNNFEIRFRGIICAEIQKLIFYYQKSVAHLPKMLSKYIQAWINSNQEVLRICIQKWPDENTLPQDLDTALQTLLPPMNELNKRVKLAPEYRRLLVRKPKFPPRKEHIESEEDFFPEGKISTQLQPIVLSLRSLVKKPRLLDAESKKSLLRQMYQYYHDCKDPQEISKIKLLLCLSLIYMPAHREDIVRYLLAGADQEYFIHKNIIYGIGKAIRLQSDKADKLAVIDLLVANIEHRSNQVRQLVVRILGEILPLFPETIAPILNRVIVKDEDKENVVRFARQALDRYGHAINQKKINPAPNLPARNGYKVGRWKKKRKSEPYVAPRLVLETKNLEDLFELLYAGDNSVFDELERRHLFSKSLEERGEIVDRLQKYLTQAPIDNHSTCHACCGCCNCILFNMKPSEDDSKRKIYEALTQRLGSVNLERDRQLIHLIMSLLNVEEFNEYRLRSLELIMASINNDLFKDCVSLVNEFLSKLFSQWLITKEHQTEDIFLKLSRMTGSNETLSQIMPMVLMFLQNVLSDFCDTYEAIKYKVLNLLLVLSDQVESLPMRMMTIILLDNLIQASQVESTRTHAKLNKAEIIKRPYVTTFLEDDKTAWLQRPDEVLEDDWVVARIIHAYQRGAYDKCIYLVNEYEKKTECFNAWVRLLKAKVLYAQRRLDAAQLTLKYLENDYPFSIEVFSLSAEIYYLKGQCRLAEGKLEDIKKHFPFFPGFSTVKIKSLSEQVEHRVMVYHPMKHEVDALYRSVINLFELNITDDEFTRYKNHIENQCTDIFGLDIVKACKIQYDFDWVYMQNLEYLNEKKRYLNQFIEFLIRVKLERFYRAQFTLFKDKDESQSNVTIQIAEAQLPEIYAQIYEENISPEDLLAKLHQSGARVMPIFHFIRKYASDSSIVGAFTLGISDDLASSYDTMMRLFGLQPWAMSYGEFNIVDKEDEIHTPAALTAMTEDARQRLTIFFIPSGIGDDRNSTSVTYREVHWMLQQMKDHPERLSRVIFVLDAYNYFPYWLLSRDEHKDVEPEASGSKLREFIEDEVLGSASQIIKFKEVQKKAKDFNENPVLYQYELLYDWIVIVDYSEKNPTEDDKLKLAALEEIRNALIKYFETNNANQFIEDCRIFLSKFPAKIGIIKNWLNEFTQHPDFDEVMHLEKEPKKRLYKLISPTISVAISDMFGTTAQRSADTRSTDFDDPRRTPTH